MKCLYCQKRVLAFRLLGGGDVFCSEEHQELYRKQMAESAIERILKMEAKPKTPLALRVEIKPESSPAPVPEVEERLPEMAGFRMEVLQPADSFVLAGVALELQPAIVDAPEIRLSPVRVAGEAIWSMLDPDWAVAVSFSTTELPALLAPESSRLPAQVSLTMVPHAASLGSPTAAAFSWQPLAERSAVAGREPLQRPIPARTPSLASPGQAPSAAAAPQALWSPPAADAGARLTASHEAIDAAPAIALPVLAEPAFVSSWTASSHPSHSLWRSSLDAGQLPQPSFELRTDASRQLCEPAPLDRRISRLGTPPARPLLAAAREAALLADSRNLPDAGRPLAWPASQLRTQPPAAPARPLPWTAARPAPHVRMVQSHPALEITAWTAWPELLAPLAGLSSAAAAPLSPQGRTPLNRLEPAELTLEQGPSQAPRLPHLPAPDYRPARTACATLTLAANAQLAVARPRADLRRPENTDPVCGALYAPEFAAPPALPATTLTRHAWAAQPPQPAEAPTPTPGAPRHSLRQPAETPAPRARQTLAAGAVSAPWNSASPSAPPEAAARPTPEIALAAPREPLRPAALGGNAPLAPAAPLQTVLRPAAPAAEHSPWVAAPRESQAGLRPPAHPANRAARLDRQPAIASLWGETGDGRRLADGAARRDAPLRLAVREFACRPVDFLVPPAPACSRGAAIGVPLRAVRALPEPARLEILARASTVQFPAGLPGAGQVLPASTLSAAPLAWRSVSPAPDVAARKRHFPASRPRMQPPKTKAPTAPLSFPLAAGATPMPVTHTPPAVNGGPAHLLDAVRNASENNAGESNTGPRRAVHLEA